MRNLMDFICSSLEARAELKYYPVCHLLGRAVPGVFYAADGPFRPLPLRISENQELLHRYKRVEAHVSTSCSDGKSILGH